MIKNHVSKLLGERKMSIREFGRRMNIPYTQARDLYHGTRKSVNLAILEKACGVLDVGVGDILEYVPEEPDPNNAEAA